MQDQNLKEEGCTVQLGMLRNPDPTNRQVLPFASFVEDMKVARMAEELVTEAVNWPPQGPGQRIFRQFVDKARGLVLSKRPEGDEFSALLARLCRLDDAGLSSAEWTQWLLDAKTATGNRGEERILVLRAPSTFNDEEQTVFDAIDQGAEVIGCFPASTFTPPVTQGDTALERNLVAPDVQERMAAVAVKRMAMSSLFWAACPLDDDDGFDRLMQMRSLEELKTAEWGSLYLHSHLQDASLDILKNTAKLSAVRLLTVTKGVPMDVADAILSTWKTTATIGGIYTEF